MSFYWNVQPKVGSQTVPMANHQSPVTIPESDWPELVKLMALTRKAGDAGLGDTVTRFFGGKTISMSFERWFKRAFGRDCGCSNRCNWLNQRYPYLSQ